MMGYSGRMASTYPCPGYRKVKGLVGTDTGQAEAYVVGVHGRYENRVPALAIQDFYRIGIAYHC